MKSRRSFIKKLGLSVASIPFAGTVLEAASTSTPDEKPWDGKIRKPIILSTWPFGQVANQAGWDILSKGGTALDAVENTAKFVEADLTQKSVGLGALPDRDGFVTLDACIMDEKGNCGSVMFLENILHPISVARMVMEKTPHVQLVGIGAQQFAFDNGFPKHDAPTESSRKDWENWKEKNNYTPKHGLDNHDTIGVIALDINGNLSGACTTSGLAFKMRGRVGDSPIIGAGLFVDNEVGAATATGTGEEVVRICGTHLVVELMRQGYTPADACKEAVTRIINKSPKYTKDMIVGFLALNKKGEYGAYSTRKGFEYGVYDNTGTSLQKAEFIEKE
jgi:N4-(beta-N-acetylglucosaminyl)-L-asparaginase